MPADHIIQPQPAPSVTIDATDPHGARILRDLARLTRPTNQARAEELEKSAAAFDLWRTGRRRR